MSSKVGKRRVYVTGAGFTRAFIPTAPLLVGNFENDHLVDAVRNMPAASRVLENERHHHSQGHINIERLMTRLYELMPYDQEQGSEGQFAFLLDELQNGFRRTIEGALEGYSFSRDSDLVSFVQHCCETSATCITFNYDELLDEALHATRKWNPYWGYGFFCRSSDSTVSNLIKGVVPCEQLLLKLHGSLNWWPRLGYTRPYALDAIVHHQTWEGYASRMFSPSVVAAHLDHEPFIVPPILTKSDLVAQPVLRLVWTLAFEKLATADAVTFIGYSFPATDAAARVLFSEALADLPIENITVVGLESQEEGVDALRARYREVLGPISDEQFYLQGALPWIQSLVKSDS